MGRSYEKGRRFEYLVKEKLEQAGYMVIRSAGSHSPFDLVAVGKEDIMFIQCKNSVGRAELMKTMEKLRKIKNKFFPVTKKIKVLMIYKEDGTRKLEYIVV